MRRRPESREDDTCPPYRTLGQFLPIEVMASQQDVLVPHLTLFCSNGVDVGAFVIDAFIGASTSTTALVGFGAITAAAGVIPSGGVFVGVGIGETGLSVGVDIRSTTGTTNFSAKRAELFGVGVADKGGYVGMHGAGVYDVGVHASKQLLLISLSSCILGSVMDRLTLRFCVHIRYTNLCIW
jgi:hypothetical protein